MAQASISVVDTIVELPLPCGQSHGAPYVGGCKSPWSQRPRPLDFIGSSYAARAVSTRPQTAHSNVCKPTPGRAGSILASLISALHFGQAGRPNATGEMKDDSGRDWGMVLPPRLGRKRNTFCHRECPGGGAVVVQIYAAGISNAS